MSRARSSSNYLVLSQTEDQHQSEHQEGPTPTDSTISALNLLPYRKAYYVIPAFALIDLACSVVFIAFAAHRHAHGLVPLLLWHALRPASVMLCGLSWRIREKGLVMLLISLVSLLLVLWHANALIQGFKIDPAAAHRIFPFLLFSHLIFGLAHWILFVSLIGVRKDVNPFGYGNFLFDASDFIAPMVSGPDLNEDETEAPSRLLLHHQDTEAGDSLGDEEGASAAYSYGSESELDPDDIVDMPEPSDYTSSSSVIYGAIRNRASAATLRPSS